MGENVAQKLDKAIASINKGADKKEEMRLMMGPNSDWDRYFTSAPLSIALLGQLILISTDTDFSLQDKKKSIKFTLLKYPDSFRASVVQIINRGWGAFNKAHTCMDQIRLYSGNVDKYVKMAVKFLLNGSPQEVKLMLPKALKSIENTAYECLAAATKVEEEFVFVMEMVAELLEACTRAQGQHQQDLKDVEIQKKVVEECKKALEVEKQQAQGKKEKMMKEMKEAENEYEETPQDYAECPKSNSRSSDQRELFKLVPKIHGLTLALVELACGGKNDKGKAWPKWNDIAEQKVGAKFIECTFMSMVKRSLPVGESKMKQDVKKIINDGIKICGDLLSLKTRMRKGEDEIEDVMSRAQELSDKVEGFRAASDSVLNRNSFATNPPQRSKQQSSWFKRETPKKVLKDTRAMYDKSCDDLAKRSKEMGEVLGDLAKINLEKIDHETVVKTLKRGIQALAELQEQWGKLVQFFQMRDVIFGQAFQANQIAYVLNSISSVYVEVSDKHLMERITCLGKLIVLDPVKDAKEIQLKRQELNEWCKEAQDAIKKIALEKKKQMSDALDERIGRIEMEVRGSPAAADLRT